MAFLKTAKPESISTICFKRKFYHLVGGKSKKNLLLSVANSSSIRQTAVSAAAVKHVVDTKIPKRDPLDLTFANPEASFKSKTTWEVLRALIVYQMCSSSYLVDNNMKVYTPYISTSKRRTNFLTSLRIAVSLTSGHQVPGHCFTNRYYFQVHRSWT